MQGRSTDMVTTVRGPRPISDLGITLAHEHIVIDTTPHQFSHGGQAPRLLLDYQSEAAVVDALHRYKQAGGASLIECTPAGCGRNPLKLRDLAERLDLHIICSTGWYRQENYPNDIMGLAASGRAEIILKELAFGIGDTGIRPGIIKIGTSAVITSEEEITLRAAARAQSEAHVGLAIHISNIEHDGPLTRLAEMPAAHRVLDIVEAEGADLAKICLCHADGTYLDAATAVPLHISLLKRGVFLSYDQFALRPIPERGIAGRPTDDAERIRSILTILDAEPSYLGRILISQDVSSQDQLRIARGNAYAHLLTSVRSQFLEAGLTERDVLVLLSDNPASFVATERLPGYSYRDPVKEFGKSAWYWHRSIRSLEDPAGLYFSPEHVPILHDAALRTLSQAQLERALEVHLAILLHFTTWLELNPVLEVCRTIFENGYNRLVFSEATRETALKIMTDEVSHTDLCFEYLQEIEATISTTSSEVAEVSAQRLKEFVASTPEAYRDIAVLAYVLASETTISAALEVAPSDNRVRSRVREILRDHAEDERRHQSYFSEILQNLWAATPDEDIVALSQLLYRALSEFVIPNIKILELEARQVIPALAEEVALRVAASSATQVLARRSAAPMISILRKLGAFSDIQVVVAFSGPALGYDAHSLAGSKS